MNKITTLLLSAFFAVVVCACSDESSDSSDINGPDARLSSSSQELSSGEEADIFVEYVEPPTLSCENVESILVDSEDSSEQAHTTTAKKAESNSVVILFIETSKTFFTVAILFSETSEIYA